MSKKEYGLMLVLAMIAGLVGGAVSTRLFVGEPVCAQPPPQIAKVIRAEKIEAGKIEAGEIEVVDFTGKTRIRLGTKGVGAAHLSIFDSEGNTRIALVAGSLGVGNLLIYDGEGNIAVSLGMMNKWRPVLNLTAKETNVWLLVAEDGPALSFTEKYRFRLGLNVVKGEPSLQLADQDGVTRAVLGSVTLENKKKVEVKYPVSSLTLLNKDGEVIWKAP